MDFDRDYIHIIIRGVQWEWEWEFPWFPWESHGNGRGIVKMHGNGNGNGNEFTGNGNELDRLFPCLAKKMQKNQTNEIF